jgi:hypothetical protein
MNQEVAARCSEGYPCLREAELSARRTAAPSRRSLSSPWIRRPLVVDGSGIARRSIAAAARFWLTPLDAGGGLTGRRLARPCLPDVPADWLKRSCSLVEPGLHPADLLELWVVTPRRNGDHS